MLLRTLRRARQQDHRKGKLNKRNEGEKIVQKSKAKAYRLIKKQEEQIANLKRMIEKYKKREYRQKVKLSNNVNTSPSQSKRVREIVGKDKVSRIVKRQLFLEFALEKQLKTKKKYFQSKKKLHRTCTKSSGMQC